MSETRVKIQSIIENQIPDFIAEESPLLVEFLKQYYVSQEYQGASADLIQNIDKYLKLEKNAQTTEFTYLSEDLDSFSTTINAGALGVGGLISTFTQGFPDRYGLLLIDDEIITYEYKTETTFENCSRGFSGVTSYRKPNVPDELTFRSSAASDHTREAKIYNLSDLFLQEFFAKIKNQFIPGFSERPLEPDLNKRSFILNSVDFYDSKGTDDSFKILFGALYGEQVDVIKPREYLFRPSDAGYRRTKDLVVEAISGNPLDLLNKTLYQDEYSEYAIENSYASITDVEKIFLGGEEYFKLSFDSDYNKDIILEGSLYGNFTLHPKTRIVSQVSSGSTVIDVDSTVGFPTSGTLVTTYSSGSEVTLSYSGKSVTQFYNVTNVSSTISPETEIRLDVYAYGYVGITTEEKIRVRIGSVLDETIILNDTYLFSKDDTARIKTLGISSSTVRRRNWIDNVANTFKVSSFILQDSSNFTYDVTLFDSHNFRIGDTLQVTNSSSVSNNSIVVDVLDDKRFSIRGQGQLSNNLTYIVSRYITKPNSSIYPQLNVNTANVQNVYTNYSDEVLVASSSIPFYYDQLLNPYDKKVTFSGSFSGEVLQITSGLDHGFYTGDKVYYSPGKVVTVGLDDDLNSATAEVVSKFPELVEGLYYIKRIDATRISLAKSPSNIADNNFISVSGIVTSNTLSYYDFANKNLQSQNILREVIDPVNKSGNYETNPGKIGILVNGVEILNYKSAETIFYGQIDNLDVSSRGSGYDVLNPPSLDISDSQGIGATGICAVNGSLQRIEIIDPGFDYVNKPFVTITGGNGKNALAEINIVSVEHNSFFNAESSSTNVNLFTDTIGFATYHKFRDYERVIYLPDGQKGIAGLTTEASYYVSVIDTFNVKLHEKESEAISGINTVNLNDYGTGIHRFKAAVRKEIISDIIVTNSGEGYQNKERSISVSGISTALSTINIESHGYLTGEEIVYSTNGAVISGLNTTSQYVVKKIDENSFKLAPVGLGTTSKTYYLETEQFIKFGSTGSGTHTFNYTPITVNITGNIGVSTLSGQDFSAKIQPIFRGSIDSVYLTTKGSNYGSEEVINYNRQPIYNLRSGTSAELVTIVDNQGKITEVLVTRPGSGYNSPPDLLITGRGNYAKLTPIVENGQLIEVKVINGGIGYEDGTTIDVIPAGQNCRLFANIQKWTVNLFQKYFNILGSDDGVVTLSNRDSYGLQYCHLYAPRKLRESLYAKSQNGDNVIDDLTLYGITDLREVNNEEVSSTYHSPIVGWSYDGNPIYGPYGYSTPTGGTAKAMLSGYELVSKTNRPSLTYFSQGFFNEDYEFKGNGDLDEHNGRFCVTPDFPNGVYAYFSTISSGSVDTDGPFRGYKRPSYPYFIGTSFYSQPNSFNFSKESNQDEYKFNDFKWFRSTLNYALKSSNSSYNYVFNPDKVKNQTVNINYASRGKVETIGILTGGTNYNVGDRLIFDNTGTGGLNAAAKVEKVFSKDVTNVSASTTSFSSVEFATLDGSGQIIGFTTSPHGLKNLELVNVSGLNTYFSKIEGTYNIGVRTDNFITTLGISTIGVTGLTTYFYLSGILEFPYIRENDILGIGTQEKVKVINVDSSSGRIRVLREYESTVSSAYTATTPLYEDPRKFRINTGFKTDYAYSANREIYFNPQESVGIGTSASVGVGTTAIFSLPGVGVTQVFVPYQSIYLPNHQLRTGEKVSYSTNGGSQILVFDGISSFSLPQTQDLYVANISNNFIGVSTVKIGLGSTGFVGVGTTTSVGLLFFKNFGTGDHHSFTTRRESIVGEISKNIVTVATASTHGLSIGDNIDMVSVPKDTETIVVRYNDNNRRVVFKPQSFSAINIDTSEDTIYIENHGFKNGDKVVYTASSPSGGLSNERIYYVLYYTKDKVRLCPTKYDLNLNVPNYINITSASDGTLSLINPQLEIHRNKVVVFDLSDSSLSFLSGPTLYSAFGLNFYKDADYRYEFEGTGTSKNFEVIRRGRVGIDTTARVSILLNDNVPDNFYYRLENVNEDFIGDIKKQIIVDAEVYNHNQINLITSKYTGSHRVTGIGTTNTFTFDLTDYPEADSYNQTTSNLYYETNSSTAYGAVSRVNIINGGYNYEFTPGISTVISNYGSGAIFEVQSNSIGSIVKNEIENIGFDYPTDLTLSPSLNLPEILQIEPLSSFVDITVLSAGKNYLTPPGLVVIDGFTKKVIDDVDLRYEIGATKVRIVKNTYGMYNTTPTIIPINNSNGVGINTISYNSTTKNVTVGFNTGFSDTFPFSIGDEVLIENTSVGVGSTARGYNSSSYDYKLFTIIAINPALGGNTGSITYNLSNYLFAGEFPGVPNLSVSTGRVVNSNDFPVFDIKLKKNDFFVGETVISQSGIGIVESWNNKIEYLKVSTDSDLLIGDTLTGQSSNTRGVIKRKIEFDSYIKLGPTSKVNKGWIYDTGFLNNNVQRIADNNYYQYFSYSLKSRVPLETWDDSVQSLNHTSGFLKFSDLMIENQDGDRISANVFAEDSVADVVVDIIGSGDLNCVYTFDLATEGTTRIGTGLVSNEIILQNRVLTDYFESVGNRVLIIDDISNQFNSNPRSTRFSTIDQFELTSARTKKYFTYVRDKRFTAERQILIVSLLHDDVNGYLNQYGRVETYVDLGSFDFSISGSLGQLNFYPIKFSVNDYDISYISHDLKSNIVGVGQSNLGSVVNLKSSQTTIPTGSSSATNIVSIADTYRSAKVIVEIGATDGSFYEFDEINLLQDGTNVDIVDYGQLTDHTIANFYGIPGLGTYIPYIDGSTIKIDFKPDFALGIGVTINTLAISIASSTSSSVGVGTEELITGYINSGIASITGSGSPVETVITEYPNDHSCAYYIVSVEDTTNQRYQMSEVLVVDDGTDASITEYGIIQTHSSLGNIGAAVSTNGTQLTFTPEPSIDVQVRVFQNALSFEKVNISKNSIDFTNAEITSNFGNYEGTERSVRRSFDLTHRQNPIFLRYFDGSDSSIISTGSNSITIPDHYFVTGEEVRYSYAGAGTTQAIGIAQTVVTGIGTTDKLPQTVYVVKLNESTVQLAGSAADALRGNPSIFDITSVGIGTSHSLTSTNQNAKNIVAIDNYFQSPIVGSSVTTTLSKDVSTVDNRLTFSGTNSFFGGNLIQINSEIMKINTVGLGSTNVILVDRPWMGTGLSTHSAGDLVRIIDGNYNIIENTIHFAEAPYGPTPIGSTTNPPNDRDWTGITTHSTFQGRTFLRSGTPNTAQETYESNYIFDGISNQFTGIGKTFTLTANNQNITGFSTNNAVILINGVFQGPQGAQAELEDYTLIESVGISSIRFTGTASSVGYDVNNASIPVGGVIVSVGSSTGFGLQPLVSAGGTAIVSAGGTISSISIGNSGSGYRIGIQTVVNVGVQTSSTGTPNIEFIGTASVSNGHIIGVTVTNPGSGYTSSNPPLVVFDDPLSYTNIPLIYSSSSFQGIGTEVKVDVTVGQGSSVIDFTIKNTGYGYGQGEILTVEIGGNTGIPTDTSKPYSEFQITIDKTYNDFFSGWILGQLEVLDSFEELFDGVTKKFPLKLGGGLVTIRAAKGSNIDVKSTLLIFINDILQKPGEAYFFEGGSVIEFSEAPKSGDMVKVLFYKGSGDIDVVFRDVLETIKVGDELTLNYEPGFGQGPGLQQEERVVTGINTTDSLETNPYSGPGITTDDTLLRPVKWCKQTSDKIINGRIVGKDRIQYEPLINPSSYLISSVGVGSTTIYVDNIKPFFDAQNESPLLTFQNQVTFISQDSLVAASGTAIVSSAGSVTSIDITGGGYGYSSEPAITIENPVGLAVSYRATAAAAIINGVVDTISVTSTGSGYTSTNPPVVLIEPPTLLTETVDTAVYSGDSGVIVGVGTTTLEAIFDLFIPTDSFLRDNTLVGSAITISGISTGDFFVIYNSNVGSASTSINSLNSSNRIIGIGTQFVDNVYQVSSYSDVSVNIIGVGTTHVRRVYVKTGISTIDFSYTTVTFDSTSYDFSSIGIGTGGVGTFLGISTSNYYGNFSWGKVVLSEPLENGTFNSYTLRGIGGISTSAFVNRTAPLKYLNYTS
jgi:hypothetical protein